MNKSGREKFHGFGQDIFEKMKSLLFPGTENMGDGPYAARGYPQVFTCAGKRGIGGQGSHRMSRHFNFGDDGHMALLRIFHQLTHLFLGVETTVSGFLPRLLQRPAVPVEIFTINAPGSHFGEPGVLFNFEPPPLVVDEMPMEDIDLMGGHLVNQRKKGSKGHKMA